MTLFVQELLQQAQTLLQSLRARNLKLTTAESCTGGLVSALITEIPGSSDVFTHGYVTYANDAKYTMLGVDSVLIAQYGAVSEEVARAMAQGAIEASGAQVSVAITGIAGPGGATAGKPVGTVHVASARIEYPTLHQRYTFSGDRATVRLQAVTAALELVQRQLNA